MSSKIVDRLKARIAELEEENAVLSAASQMRTEIYDFVVRWRNPGGGISDGNFLHVIGEAFDKSALWTDAGDPLSKTTLPSNVVAFRKPAQ